MKQLVHTSLEAFHASKPVRISHSNLIADALDKARDGLTAEQISIALGGKLDSVQVSRCLATMERDGIIERSIIGFIDEKHRTPVYHTRINVGRRRMAVWFKVRIAHG